MFRSEEKEKVKAFQKSAKRGFQVLDIVHTKHLKSEEISLLEEVLQDNVSLQKDEEYQHKHTEHAKKSLVDKDAGFSIKIKRI